MICDLVWIYLGGKATTGEQSEYEGFIRLLLALIRTNYCCLMTLRMQSKEQL